MTEFEGLPGAERVRQGIDDLSRGHHSPPALLVAAAATRLRELGIPVPREGLPEAPELALYRALEEEHDDPFAHYNALRSELFSFIAAFEARRLRELRAPGAGGNLVDVDLASPSGGIGSVK